MTTLEVFGLGMKKLGVSFNRDVGKDVLEVYWEVLGRCAAPDLARGFKRALAECKFFPPPAELRAFSKPVDNLVADTNARLDALFGREPERKHLQATVRELAEMKSVKP